MFCLATLVGIEGGAPRPLGSRMLYGRDSLAGYLSGGCVEGIVASWAEEVLSTGVARLERLGAGSRYIDVQLACGGAIEILIERIDPARADVQEWVSAWMDRREVLCNVSTSALRSSWVKLDVTSDLDPIRESEMKDRRVGSTLLKRERPSMRLHVVGGDPTALSLLELAHLAGVETNLIRPKGPTAAPLHFAGRYLTDTPAVGLAKLGIDQWTAVVTTTHESELDDEVASTALIEGAFYVGVLGSRRRAKDRLARLTARGVPAWLHARLRSPIGLEIGASTPFEIAISTFAQMILLFKHGCSSDRAQSRAGLID